MYNKTGRLNTAKMKRIKPTGSAFKMHQNILHSIEYFIKSANKTRQKKIATLQRFSLHISMYIGRVSNSIQGSLANFAALQDTFNPAPIAETRNTLWPPTLLVPR